MKLRDEMIQNMYELMAEEYGVHDEVNECFKKIDQFIECFMPESSTEYDYIMGELCDLQHVAFCAGANMVLDFIAGKEVQKNEL